MLATKYCSMLFSSTWTDKLFIFCCVVREMHENWRKLMREHYVMSTKTNTNFKNELLERASQVTLEKRRIQDIA